MSDWEADWRRHSVQRRAEVMRLPTLPVRQHGMLATNDPHDLLVAASIGPRGEDVVLSADSRGPGRIHLFHDTVGVGGELPRSPRWTRGANTPYLVQFVLMWDATRAWPPQSHDTAR